MNGECLSTNEHNEALAANDYELNADEPVVFENTFEYVEVVVQTSRAMSC